MASYDEIDNDLERTFFTRWVQLHDPDDEVEMVWQHKFFEQREWKFDFAIPALKIAIECDGGQWKAGGGRHNSDEDRWKLNCAASEGWLVLRFSPSMLGNDPDRCITCVRVAIRNRLYGASMYEEKRVLVEGQ